MNRKLKFLLITFVFVVGLFAKNNLVALADWWDRSDARPTQPSYDRNLPTLPPQATSVPPTSVPPSGTPPTATPRVGGPTVAPTAQPEAEGTTVSDEDPCAEGKPYEGSHCGWSPGVGEGVGGDGGDSETLAEGVGGPQVMGLSYTAGEGIEISDIILLTGVLCLLMYARSKFGVVETKHRR